MKFKFDFLQYSSMYKIKIEGYTMIIYLSSFFFGQNIHDKINFLKNQIIHIDNYNQTMPKNIMFYDILTLKTI